MIAKASPVLVHATSVVLAAAARAFGGPEDAAVLLLGDSGSGKSDLALRLMQAGARLISDDQTLLFVKGNRLFAAAPERTKGLMEVRGVGIIRFDTAGEGPIVLAVQLRAGDFPRLPEATAYLAPTPLSPAEPPVLIALDPFQSSAPAKILAAASAAANARFVAGSGAFKEL